MAQSEVCSQRKNGWFEQGPGNSKSRHGMVTFGRLFLSLSDDEEHEWITRTCRKAEDGAPGQKPGP